MTFSGKPGVFINTALLFGLLVWTVPAVNAHDVQVTKKDGAAAREAYKASKKGKWPIFNQKTKSIKNRDLRQILNWYRLSSQGSGANFDEISRFLSEQPEWPYRRRLAIRAEQAMKPRMDTESVFQWFKERPPLTPNGTARLAAEYLKQGNKEKAIQMVRSIWISGNFGARQERQFHRQFRKFMTLSDHLKRLDRLLWEGKYYPVRRMYRRFKDPKYRALSEARLTLRRMRGGVDRAIERVPEELRDHPGLVYERLRWRRRKGRDEQARELLVNPPDDLISPRRWWAERSILARRALRTGHITEAYRLSKHHGLSSGNSADYLEAEWLAGWIALRFLKDNTVAYNHFSVIYDNANYPVSRSRGAYWSGRAAEALGNTDQARFWYNEAFRYQTTYYGQLATAKLPDRDKLFLPPAPHTDQIEQLSFNDHKMVHMVRLLARAELRELIRPFIRHLNRLGGTPGWRSMVAALARASGRPDLAVMTAKSALRDGINLVDEGYPLLTTKLNRRVEAPFVHAIVRQESAFNAKAKSHAGALGLMQIMPRTARQVAKQTSVKYSRQKLLESAPYNLRLGQSYLRELMSEFKNSYVLTLAAYNAGPHRVKRWIKRNGDPRDEAVDAIDWIEMIPFSETRNYVQRVIENLHIYRQRLSDKNLTFNPEGILSR